MPWDMLQAMHSTSINRISLQSHASFYSRVGTLLLFCLLPTLGCSKPSKDLSSYESAPQWVRAEYAKEVMRPDSTVVDRAEYYPSSADRWLVVYLATNPGKGYLHRNFPQSQWNEWKAAPSKGAWYASNLRGNPAFRFEPSPR